METIAEMKQKTSSEAIGLKLLKETFKAIDELRENLNMNKE